MILRIKKILLPFYKKNLLLKKYWWHRLLVVLFFIVVITIGIFPLYSTIRDHNSRGALCWSNFNSDLKSNSDNYAKSIQEFGSYTAAGLYKATDEFINSGLNICLDNDWSNYIGDLKLKPIFGIIFALFSSYILQLIYFRIIYYIIFGRNQ